jgi:hypothetical protein
MHVMAATLLDHPLTKKTELVPKKPPSERQKSVVLIVSNGETKNSVLTDVTASFSTPGMSALV